jgi:hypothetical protein
MDETLARDASPPETSSTPLSAPIPVRPAPTERRRTGRVLADLLTITAGVLIALSLEGLIGWARDRRLVATARAAIEQELADNLVEVEGIAASAAANRGRIRQALQLANELIASETSTIQQVNLGFDVAELSSAGFDTAERTGALGMMGYQQARRYAQVYEAQRMFVAHQDRMLEQLEAAAASMTGDPYGALPGDIERFRQHLLSLVAMLNIEDQLLARLAEDYREAMGGGGPPGSGS